MKNYIDLHMHSLYSDDGEFTPSQLVEMCYDKGIRIMAIADHNSVKANSEGSKKAEEVGITYIPAIEIDCSFQNVNFHLLGYGIDYTAKVFQEIEENIVNQELEASEKKIALTKELGFDVTKEELDQLSSNGIYTGEMFGEIILQKEEYKDHEMLKPFRTDGSRSDNPYVNFYWDFYSQGKPCYTGIKYPELTDMVDVIHAYGGKAVLAHPGANITENKEIFDQMIKETELDGVEVFSNYHDRKTTEYYLKKARKYNRMITCGSDFHGRLKPAIKLGDSNCPYDQEFIEQMLKEQL